MFIVDGAYNGLTDIPLYPDAQGREVVDQILDAGVRLLHQSVVIDYHPTSFRAALKRMLDHEALIDTLPDKLMRVDTPQDARRAVAEDRIGLVYTFQGADAIEDDLDNLIVLHRLGLRVLQLTYNSQNRLGYGGYEPVDRGLTYFGKVTVKACNSLGVTVDLSHVGEKTSIDACEVSTRPVIISHSNCKALCDHTRNITDQQIKAVGETGGLVGITPHSVFTAPKSQGWPTLDILLKHLDRMIGLVGVDHVGLSTDRFASPNTYAAMTRKREDIMFGDFWGGYDVSQKNVQGFSDYGHWADVLRALSERGLPDEDVAKIAGGNYLRIYDTTWERP
jgi:membrane dipeptidase